MDAAAQQQNPNSLPPSPLSPQRPLSPTPCPSRTLYPETLPAEPPSRIIQTLSHKWASPRWLPAPAAGFATDLQV